MSPNLYAGADLVKSSDTYENIVENVLRLLGFSNQMKNPIDSDLAVSSEVCMVKCKSSCDSVECQTCVKCMNSQQKEDATKAYNEQMNLGDFRRAFPPANVSFNLSKRERKLIKLFQKLIKNFLTTELEKLTNNNIVHNIWFFEMCKKNQKFC